MPALCMGTSILHLSSSKTQQGAQDMKKQRRGSCVLKIWVGAFLLIPIFLIPCMSEYKQLRAVVGAPTEALCESFLAWQLLWGFSSPGLRVLLPVSSCLQTHAAQLPAQPRALRRGAAHDACSPGAPCNQVTTWCIVLLTGLKQAALRW